MEVKVEEGDHVVIVTPDSSSGGEAAAEDVVPQVISRVGDTTAVGGTPSVIAPRGRRHLNVVFSALVRAPESPRRLERVASVQRIVAEEAVPTAIVARVPELERTFRNLKGDAGAPLRALDATTAVERAGLAVAATSVADTRTMEEIAAQEGVESTDLIYALIKRAVALIDSEDTASRIMDPLDRVKDLVVRALRAAETGNAAAALGDVDDGIIEYMYDAARLTTAAREVAKVVKDTGLWERIGACFNSTGVFFRTKLCCCCRR